MIKLIGIPIQFQSLILVEKFILVVSLTERVVIHVYNRIIVHTQHLLTSLESLCKDDQKCSLGIIQLSSLPLA